MSSDPVSVTIRIIDKDYTISCPLDERDALLAAAHELNDRIQKLRDSGKILGAERMTVMTALNMIHERAHYEARQLNAFNSAQETIRRLEHKLDTAIGRRETTEPLDS